MRLKLLRLIAFAVAVVLPLQGMATVMTGQCMALGHHQDAGGDDHAHVHDQAGDHHSDQDSKSSHCGPCTACCASASIAGPAALILPPAASHSRYFFSQLEPPAVQPDALDRPPLPL